MALVYFGLGSNLGQKEKNLELAITELKKQIGPLVARSAFYHSDPWGFDSANTFINACVAVETTLSPHECLSLLKDTERRLGRLKKETDTYSDRLIDIDILFYDQIILEEDNLTVPHPLLHLRLFVLEPLAEIAPHLVHPKLKKEVQLLLKELNAQS